MFVKQQKTYWKTKIPPVHYARLYQGKVQKKRNTIYIHIMFNMSESDTCIGIYLCLIFLQNSFETVCK